jgi:hypothetical protein
MEAKDSGIRVMVTDDGYFVAAPLAASMIKPTTPPMSTLPTVMA